MMATAINRVLMKLQGFQRTDFREDNNEACVTSPSPGNQVDGLPGGVSTGTVVASWDRRRRATIGIFDMKNITFD